MEMKVWRAEPQLQLNHQDFLNTCLEEDNSGAFGKVLRAIFGVCYHAMTAPYSCHENDR